MIEVGNVYEGRVCGLKPFGAFVALPEGRVGMVHISEVSNSYVPDIASVLHDGDIVKVQVISISPDGKIALSMKRLLPPPPPRSPRAPRPDHERKAPAAHRTAAPREGGRGARGGAPQHEGAGRASARGGREQTGRVWQPKTQQRSDNMSFEDMMSRFKSQSEEKMADLDHETNNRRGGGYAPRSRRGGGR